MIAETNAILWLLSQSEKLSIEIAYHDWIAGVLDGWTDISCTSKFNSKEMICWGAAKNEDLALCKAFSETAERLVFHNHCSLTTNGFASHVEINSARKNAQFELIERDLFLCHFYSGTPFSPLPNKLLEEWGWIAAIKKFSIKEDVRIRYFYLGDSGVICIVDGLLRKRAFGFLSGTSYSQDIEQSALSSTIEACRRVHFLNRKLDKDPNLKISLSISDFLAIMQPTFGDHGALGLDVNYAKEISWMFNSVRVETDSQIIKGKAIDIDCIEVIDLLWPNDPFEKNICPFYFAKAISPRALDMFLGWPTPEKINMNRLRDFAGKEIKSFMNIPHFFD